MRRNGNFYIWLELEQLALSSRNNGEPLTKEQRAECEKRAEEATRAERRESAKEKARQRARRRRDAAKPAEKTAAKAWDTYKKKKAEGDKKKAAKWKAYAIYKAGQAIAEGKAESLPKRLRRKAENAEGRKAASGKFYRITIKEAGRFLEATDRRTAKAAQNVKTSREAAEGITAEIEQIEREADNLAEDEKKAINAMNAANRERKKKHIHVAARREKEAAELWERYERQGGRHAQPWRR